MNYDEENFLEAFTASKTITEGYRTRLLEFSPTGDYFSYTVDDTFKIFNAKSGVLKNIITVSMDRMCYFQKNTILHSKWNSIMYLSIYDNKYLRQFEAHPDNVLSMSTDDVNDCFMSVSAEKIKIWDIRYQDPILSLNSNGKLGALSKGNDFAISDYGSIYIYDKRSYLHPKEVKSIKPSFYQKLWYTDDSSCICMSSFKSHYFLDTNGDYISSLNLENDSDGCCIKDSNIFLCGSSKNLFAYKIQDKKKIGRKMIDGLEISVVRSNPYYCQFIVGSECVFKIFNRT